MDCLVSLMIIRDIHVHWIAIEEFLIFPIGNLYVRILLFIKLILNHLCFLIGSSHDSRDDCRRYTNIRVHLLDDTHEFDCFCFLGNLIERISSCDGYFHLHSFCCSFCHLCSSFFSFEFLRIISVYIIET